jgi:hypothetical protein
MCKVDYTTDMFIYAQVFNHNKVVHILEFFGVTKPE